MAVYTDVSDAALTEYLKKYDIGGLIAKKPIVEGVENTNYRVETTHGVFILTLFEKRTPEKDLPFFMALMAHLAKAGLPVAAPIKDNTGRYVGALCGRPAAIVEFLPGLPEMTPQENHCAALGALQARLHKAVADFPLERKNPLSIEGWRKLIDQCRARADECAPGLAAFIEEEYSALTKGWPQGLPGGVVHTDLFPDNVLFEENRITGVIDFYFSSNDSFAYDLAVCINAWCFDEGQAFKKENALALMNAYARRLSNIEKNAFPLLLRGAALRFLLTRLYDWLNQIEGATVTVKDPLDYKRIMAFHCAHYAPSLYGF